MSKQLEQQVMALAGLSQAIKLVHEVASTGRCDNKALQACLHSIIVTNPSQPEDVFNYSPKNDDDETPLSDEQNYQTWLKPGYQHIVNQLGNAQDKDLGLTRYNIGITSLERKLAKRNDLLSMMGERIGQVKRQLHHFAISDEQVIANFAGIYSDIISPIGAKIQINGDNIQLQQPNVQKKIRALLLAAMRACVLWRQLGGKRRQLLFNRKKIIAIAEQKLRT